MLWAVPSALVVIGYCSLVAGVLRWCGPGMDNCTRELLRVAIGWIVAGGVIGGAIIAIAPWGRMRTRLIAGIAIAVLVIVAGLISVSH